MEQLKVIYIITNQMIGDHIKFGYTDNIDKLLDNLNTSGALPYPFKVYATYLVDNKVTNSELQMLVNGINTVNINGDYYSVKPEQVYGILEVMAKCSNTVDRLSKGDNYKHVYSNTKPTEGTSVIAVVTPDNTTSHTPTNSKRFKANGRQEPFTFSSAQVPVGAELIWIDNTSIKCTVVDDRHVSYNGKTYSLSTLDSFLCPRKNGRQGPAYFTYKGELLTLRRKRLAENAGVAAEIITEVAGSKTDFSFTDIGLTIGSLLSYNNNPNLTCLVANNNHVRYRGVMYTLVELVEYLSGNTETDPLEYFYYKDKKLSDMLKENE